jgi:putative ABC transport system permease protein
LIGYSVSQRYKEISIRKIFGAETSSILILFAKEYAKLMLIATAIGIPVINYFIQEWMYSFPYRSELKMFIFALPIAILFLISLAIILSQSLKATRINAAETLRNE